MRYMISVFIISSLGWVITMMKHQQIHTVYKHMDEGKSIPHVLSAAFKVSEREIGTQSTHTQALLVAHCWIMGVRCCILASALLPPECQDYSVVSITRF